MKKYVVNISGLTSFEFFLPVFKGRKTEVLTNLLLTLGNLALIIFLVTLPSIGIFINRSIEDGTFTSLIFFVSLMLGFYGAVMLLQGKKVLVDPKNFLAVLLFALLTTAASVMKSPTHISNTFGVQDIRMFAGITIMALIGLFFFINFVAKDLASLKRIASTFNFAFGLFIVVLIFHVNAFDTYYVNENLPIVLFAYVVSILSIVFSSKAKVLRSILLALSAFFLFITPQNVPDSVLSTMAITFTVMALLILLSVYAVINKELVITKLVQFTSQTANLKDKKYSITEVTYFLLIAVSALAIVVGVLIHFRFNFTLDLLTIPINEFLMNLTTPFNGSINISRLLLGNGAYDFSKQATTLSSSLSSMVNIVYTQGLVGTIAYIFLFITGFYTVIKAIKKSLVTRVARGLVFGFSLSLIFVSVVSFFSYAGEAFAIIWWISFALLSAYLSVGSVKEYVETNWNVSPLILKDKLGVYFRVVVAILFILLILFIYNTFRTNSYLPVFF